VISEYEVDRIDVLKIDVEGSEWEVLGGIEQVHWPRVQQVVVEVHDIAGRVADIAGLLRGQNFETTIDQEDWAIHRLLGIYTVYARRS
jgi:hypothetical protein